MTRFDAATSTDRRELYRDGVEAHRERGDGVLTLDADAASLGADGPDPELGVPWLQYERVDPQPENGDRSHDERAGDLVSMDCTDAELERLKDLLQRFPELTIDELLRPEDADGTHARIRGHADADRLAQLFEDGFRTVYDLPETYRVWVTSI